MARMWWWTRSTFAEGLYNPCMSLTLYEKLWSSHLVREDADGTGLIYIDRHLVHEVTSPQAFEGLEVAHRKPWRIDSVIATADHNVPTTPGRAEKGIADPIFLSNK